MTKGLSEKGGVTNSFLGLLYGHGIFTIYYYDDLHVYYI